MRAALLAALVLIAMMRLGATDNAHAVAVEMRNVDLHLTAEIGIHIRYLRGQFLPAGTRQAPILDDPRSYSVTIDSGEVALDLPSLNALMTRTLKDHSNVRRLQISIDENGRLREQGTVSRGIPLRFDVKASADVTPAGLIRIRADSVKGFGVPVTPVLKVFSVEMDDLLRIDPGRGMVVNGNDLLLDPARLLPPPALHGTISAVRIERDAMVQIFGPGARRPMSPPAPAKNFIYWRGGQLTFGKLTMADTDLELIDEDPGDPFDFSVDRWNEQLIAGYSKVTAARGLTAYMPDYNDLRTRRAAHPAPHR